jgi:hypothetical protein
MICHCPECLYHRSRLARVLAWAHAWELTLGPQISMIGPFNTRRDADFLVDCLQDIRNWEGLQARLGDLFHDLAVGA